MLHPVIMAGGSGTRFWPRSRRQRPKQLIRIFGEGSMIQQTVSRLESSFPPESFLIMTNAAQAEEVRRQLPQFSAEQVVAEPVGRDNAACIGLAALILLDQDPDAAMLVLSSDHVMSPMAEFARCVAEGERIALRQYALVTFGVKPSYPERAIRLRAPRRAADGAARRAAGLPPGAVQGEALEGAGGGVHPEPASITGTAAISRGARRTSSRRSGCTCPSFTPGSRNPARHRHAPPGTGHRARLSPAAAHLH